MPLYESPPISRFTLYGGAVSRLWKGCAMPQYPHRCPFGHGDFYHERPMAQSSDPAPCPECGASSRRIMKPKDLQMFFPINVRGHVDTTGLRDVLGNGPGLDLARRRWDE